MTVSTALRGAYLFNIAVLLPVILSLYAHEGRGALAAFNAKVDNVDGLRLLVAALWSGVLVASVLGLWRPEAFAGLLVFQVIYKAIWLVTFVLPVWRSGGATAVPWGVTSVFIFIVLLWPVLCGPACKRDPVSGVIGV